VSAHITRRQRDQQGAYANGFDAYRPGTAGQCFYRRPWLRAAWRLGWAAAARRAGAL